MKSRQLPCISILTEQLHQHPRYLESWSSHDETVTNLIRNRSPLVPDQAARQLRMIDEERTAQTMKHPEHR